MQAAVAKRPRILALDILRGFFLFVIIIDHVHLFPNVFELFTGRGELWASAAEGFFIISGLLVGYIYGPRMARNVLQTTKTIWKRAFLLYALTVILTWLFVWWGNNSDIANVKEGLWIAPPLGEFLLNTFTLNYYYGWADFLPYYAIFMVFAPLALYACIKRLGWLVIMISILIWAVRGTEFELAWQLLFMSSIVAGWYLPQIESAYQSLPQIQKRRLSISVYALAILILVASAASIHLSRFVIHDYASFAQLPAGLQYLFIQLDNFRVFMTPLIVKWSLEPVRLFTALVWFVALYLFVRNHEASIQRVTRGFLKTLGEQSLTVYVTHAIVIFGFLLVFTADSYNFFVNTLLSALVVGFIYLVARCWPYANRRVKGALHSIFPAHHRR